MTSADGDFNYCFFNTEILRGCPKKMSTTKAHSDPTLEKQDSLAGKEA